MDTTHLAPLLAVGAVLGTIFGVVVRGWTSLKEFCQSTMSIVVETVHIDDQTTSQVVLAHLLKTLRRSRMTERTFGGRHETFRSGKFGHVPFEFFGQKRIIFWRRWWPLIYTVNRQVEDPKDDKAIYWNKPERQVKGDLMFIRGTFDVDAIIAEASQQRNQMAWAVRGRDTRRRFFIKKIPDSSSSADKGFRVGTGVAWFYEGVYRLIANKPEELGQQQDTHGRAADALFFPAHIKNLIHEAELWRNRRDWYTERCIPWKRGWLLYGPPGTGKTALVRALAEDLDMPLFVFRLGELTNSELEQAWVDMQAHTPCVALFEDFDNVFHGRENIYNKPSLADVITSSAPGGGQVSAVTKSGLLGFDCLLNCLDGADKSQGVFTVITTNHVDKLDPALGQPRHTKDGTIELVSTRPGRIDKAIELGYMTMRDKLRMAKRIFFDNHDGYLAMKRLLRADTQRQETPAQFQERCACMALDMLWQTRNDNTKLVDRASVVC